MSTTTKPHVLIVISSAKPGWFLVRSAFSLPYLLTPHTCCIKLTDIFHDSPNLPTPIMF